MKKLKDDMKYDDKVAAAIKSLLYDIAKAKFPKEGTSMERAEFMFKNTTKVFIKEKITNKMIDDRLKVIQEKHKNKENNTKKAK